MQPMLSCRANWIGWPVCFGLVLWLPAQAVYVSDDPEPTDYGHFEIYTFNNGTATRDGAAGESGVDFNYGAAPDLQLTAPCPRASIIPLLAAAISVGTTSNSPTASCIRSRSVSMSAFSRASSQRLAQSGKSAHHARQLSTGHGKARTDIWPPSQIVRRLIDFDTTRRSFIDRFTVAQTVGSSRSQSTSPPAALDPHSACGTALHSLSAVSFLGGFRMPAAEIRGGRPSKRPASETLPKFGSLELQPRDLLCPPKQISSDQSVKFGS
jgi:hypothetical protein